ncbi:1-acyl-sn-glycerol-3-phosphate acyltransferase [Actomonas aquatica]|uniref:1-acyl-sn-glycerol-3-phosphate acyltransferase n=1 Tax=Actomonas aquatica TaxID=2866162 RepID=A0ABZ1C4U9_9BACT|nr:1-acyl-sn-glycerol-3-phosphate acyltransferase [Opitutus sp. WL0086]WRQ86390.1 1-acyl-sn-glycerol-3-phosphate acyltransferase [Opitutus sp. WL0086]
MSAGAGTSWLGRMARGLVHGVARFYYPRIEVTGAVPEDGPVLLVANHPNSLLDPVLLGVAARRPVRLMAKAPLFTMPVFGRIMHALGMIPAYRGSDGGGRAEVKKNLESLAQAAAALGEGGGSVVGIFPEGKSHDDVQVALVRSGAARMAMAAVEAGVRGLRVVPVGINYERKERFRTAVWIQVGAAIEVDALLAEHEGDGRAAMRALTPVIDAALKDVVVHLEEAQWEPLLEEVEGLLPARRGLRVEGVLKLRKRVADAINHYHRADRARAEAMAARVEAWRARRQASGLPADARFFRQPLARRLVAVAWDAVRLVVALGLGSAGLLHHLVPHGITRVVAARFDHPGRVTVALHRVLVGVPVYGLWYAGVAVAMLRYFMPWVAVTWLALMPAAGLCAIWVGRRLRVVLPIWWAEVKLLLQRRRVVALRRERAELVEALLAMAADFPGAETAGREVERKLWRPPLWVSGVIAAALSSVALVVGGWLLRDRPLEWRQTDAPALHQLEPAVLAERMGADERGLVAVIDGLADLEARFRVFEKQLHAGERSYYRPEDDDEMRRMLVSYLSLRQALLRTVWRYQRYAQVGDERLRLRALLLHYAAAAVVYDYSARFVLAFEGSETAIRKLNEAEPRWGVPAGVYDRIRANLANIAHRRWLEAGWRHYHETLPAWESVGLGPGGEDVVAARLHAAIAEAGARTAALSERILVYKVATAMSDAKAAVGGSYYRASAAISTLIGDAKIRAPREGKTLVTPELLERLQPLLQPGDILIERRNWYMSNAFLPGYWPHAALYVGTAEDVRALGLAEDPAVAAKLAEFAGTDAAGHAFAVIEAMSEGVVFTSIEHSIGEADAVAVLRPRLSVEQKRTAIARAFSHAGKPYDFDFDFFSSDRLVCTEVVYRSYGDMLEIPLVEILGRQTLPAIEIVRVWAEESVRADAGEGEGADAGGQFEFIALLDGDEEAGTCTWADAATLRESLGRPALTWFN